MRSERGLLMTYCSLCLTSPAWKENERTKNGDIGTKWLKLQRGSFGTSWKDWDFRAFNFSSSKIFQSYWLKCRDCQLTTQCNQVRGVVKQVIFPLKKVGFWPGLRAARLPWRTIRVMFFHISWGPIMQSSPPALLHLSVRDLKPKPGGSHELQVSHPKVRSHTINGLFACEVPSLPTRPRMWALFVPGIHHHSTVTLAKIQQRGLGGCWPWGGWAGGQVG